MLHEHVLETIKLPVTVYLNNKDGGRMFQSYIEAEKCIIAMRSIQANKDLSSQYNSGLKNLENNNQKCSIQIQSFYQCHKVPIPQIRVDIILVRNDHKIN